MDWEELRPILRFVGLIGGTITFAWLLVTLGETLLTITTTCRALQRWLAAHPGDGTAGPKEKET